MGSLRRSGCDLRAAHHLRGRGTLAEPTRRRLVVPALRQPTAAPRLVHALVRPPQDHIDAMGAAYRLLRADGAGLRTLHPGFPTFVFTAMA
jgi:hypothetical protein